MQKLDLWLRGVWAFWDTHGTRLLGLAQIVWGIVTVLVQVFVGPDAKVGIAMAAVSAQLGWMTVARGRTNAKAQETP